MAAKGAGWGGPRKGSGPKKQPEETVRSVRVTFTLTPADHRKLVALAKEKDLPTGTAAYQIVAKVLRRRP